MPRLRIGKQLELSTTAGSVLRTAVNNELEYVAPGTNGQVFTLTAGVPGWATPNAGTSNLALGTATATTFPITNDNGTGFTLPGATTSLAGLLVAADKTKLDFITITQAVDLDELEAESANLVTLSGVASDAVNLGTFTGATLTDNITIKAALQELETAIENIPDAETHYVADITARDALTVQAADIAYVADASADGTVTSGGAQYIWSGAAWVKMAEFESMDLTNFWSITDGTTTQQIDGGNTLTVTGTNAVSATVSATDTLTVDVTETVELFTPAAAATTVTIAGTVQHGLKVFRNGILQDITADYTVAGQVVTLVEAIGSTTGGAAAETVKVVYFS